MWRKLFVRLNNCITAWRHIRVPAANILLILPHCLHSDTCSQNVVRNLDECRQCGKCPVGDLLKVRNDYSLICCIVGGGHQALAQTSREDVKAVVAVACNRELVQGIISAFPKPVLAVSNTAPEGPCRNTQVDVARVSKAIESIIRR